MFLFRILIKTLYSKLSDIDKTLRPQNVNLHHHNIVEITVILYINYSIDNTILCREINN